MIALLAKTSHFYSTMEREHMQPGSDDTDILLGSIAPDNINTAPLPKPTNDAPRGWPMLPRRVKTSLHTRLTEFVVDMVLLACSVAFLAFAMTVIKYDQAPVHSHSTLAQTLESAAKYVGYMRE